MNFVSAHIASRYSRSNHGSSFISLINKISVAGIALGLMALIVVVSIMNGFEHQLKQRVLGVVPHIVVPNSAALENPSNSTISFSESPYIKTFMPYESVDAIVQSSNAIRGVQLQGVEPDIMQRYSVFADNMLFGSLNIEAGSFDVLIGRALATQMDINPNDTLRILLAGKTIYSPFGRIPSQRLVRVAGFFDLKSQADSSAILMHWKDVKKLKREKATSATHLRLFLHDAFDYQKVQQWLSDQDIESTSWRDQQGTLFDAVKMEKNMMFIMLMLIISVAAFNIVSSLVMVVTEKQSDIAILQTQGMNPHSIMSIFLYNGLLNGLRGTLFGSILGLVLLFSINPALELVGINLGLALDGRSVPFVFRPDQIASVIGLSLFLCLLASAYPSYRAMKVQPAQILHNS